jgi:hypothetical protein
MTENGLNKLNGHRVFIEMREFPHSVKTITYTGELIASPGKHHIHRDQRTYEYDHTDFYIDDEKTDKLILIEWNKVKLITHCEDLGKVRK